MCRVGPGSYNSHEVLKQLTRNPCSAAWNRDNKTVEGKGNYVYIADQIVYDSEMDRMFPNTAKAYMLPGKSSIILTKDGSRPHFSE